MQTLSYELQPKRTGMEEFNSSKQDEINFMALIAKLDELVTRDISYLEGAKEAVVYVKTNGGSSKVVPEEDGGGMNLFLGGRQASIFQPFPEIDRIYYEY